MIAAIDRFWAKVDKHADGCWIWRGVRNTRTGRAYFKVRQRNYIAARWLWAQLHGAIPAESVVMHTCDNQACVNPDHLRLGTQLENIADRDAKGRNRLRATHCINGHELTGDNVRLFGPNKKWRSCRACSRQFQRKHRARLTKIEAEHHS